MCSRIGASRCRRGRTLGLGIGLVVLGAGGACNALFGLDDLRYEATAGPTSATGSAGSGADGADGGRGGAGGVAGSGGTAGSAGAGAGPTELVTVSLGERPTSEVQAVTADTQLWSDQPNRNYGGSADMQTDTDPARAVLLRFDLTTISPAAVVAEATLRLWTGACLYCELSSGTVELAAVLEPWEENVHTGSLAAACWNERLTGVPWTGLGAGGGSLSPEEAGEFFPGAVDTEYEVDLAAEVVQAWIEEPATNCGLRLVSTSPAGDGVLFHSSESAEATKRPELTVIYWP